ncbi:unnamed protein product [marine sediment metagenome]|uniref:Uncharacterized protein n=1 Tax=marine sediment metagenome TaxID=412755 RepID=X1CUB2_9ZZZZ
MYIAIVDARRYGKQTKYYVLNQDAANDTFPSVNWREVKKEDFAAEAISAYIDRL